MLLRGVSIGYGRHVVASDISLSLDRGALCCLLGRNGCGKSTLLRTISMLQKPLAGDIFYGDRSLQTMSRSELAQTIGIVLTGRVEGQRLVVADLVALGRIPYTDFFGSLTVSDADIVEEAMSLVGILPLADRLVSTLSDGEYQKAIIAKTLAQQTPVILFDEPTAFLDYSSKVDLMDTIRALAHDDDKVVLLSTHDVNLAMRMADVIFLMAEGRVWRSEGEDDVKKFIGARAASFL